MAERTEGIPRGLPPSLRSLFATASAFLAAALLLRPYYGGNDDGTLSILARGAWKATMAPSESLLFIHSYLGKALKGLYLLRPEANWYGWVMAVSFFLAIWAMFHAALSTRRAFLPNLLLACAFLTAFLQYFGNFHYTTFSVLLAQAGVLLVLTSDPAGHPGRNFLPATGLVLLSALIRFEGALLGLLTLAPFAFMRFQEWPTPGKKTGVILGGILAALLSAVFLTDRLHYLNRPGWDQVHPYWSVSSNLIEYRSTDQVPDLDGKLAEAGWTPLEFELLAFRIWQDPKFSLENLRKLDAHLGPVFTGKGLEWHRIFGERLIRVQLAFFLVLLVFLPSLGRRRLLWSALWIFSILLYLFYFKKFAAWFLQPMFSVLPILCALDAPSPAGSRLRPAGNRWRFRGAVAALILLAVLSFHFLARTLSDNHKRRQQEILFTKDLRDFERRSDRLHLLSTLNGGFPIERLGVFGDYGLFDRFPVYRLSWEQNTPREKAVLGGFGIENLFTDPVGRKDVLLISSGKFRDLYRRHALERYHTTVDFEEVFRGKSFSAYRVVPGGRPLKGSGT